VTDSGRPHRPTLLSNLRLVDPGSNTITDEAWVRVADGRIVEIGFGQPTPGDSATEDLSGAFVIPGLWDVHVHPTGYVKNIPGETVAERTLRAVDELLDGLRAGVTSVRSAGEADYIDSAVNDFFARGRVPGPRVVPCGYAHITTVNPGQPVAFARVCDGPQAWQVAVREAIQHGAEFFKILISGGLRWPKKDNFGLLQDEAELVAAFGTAQQRGIPVLAHAINPVAVKAAVRLGARSVEHGYVLDEESIVAMRDAGTFFVPTLAYSQLGAGVARDEFEEAEVVRLQASPKLEEKAARAAESFKSALAAGVKIACGSDVSGIAEGARIELAQLVRFGMKPADALIAATRTAAELCGYGDVSGEIAVGKDADLVALDRNPLEDITAVRAVRGVWKGGVRV
jgi:imidazolonepropionase-like amidohydrolase